MEPAPPSEVPGPALGSREEPVATTAPPAERERAVRHPLELEPRERDWLRERIRATALAETLSPAIPHPLEEPRDTAEPRTRAGLAALLDALRLLWSAPVRVAVAGLALYVFAFNVSVVRGGSMSPGIHDGDRILIDQVSYLFQGVERGDIVVLRYPLDPSLDYIKRVVGLPGDEVVLAAGRLWVNGELVEEPYVEAVDPYSHLYVRVEERHFFVLGDNRPHSSDSREFGQVAEGLLRGKVDLRLWPPARLGRIR